MIKTRSLTDGNYDEVTDRATLLESSDRAIIRHEFVICYEEPIDSYEDIGSQRGYLTIWWENYSGNWERKQLLSGDDRMIQQKFGRCASGSVETIERIIGVEEV